MPACSRPPSRSACSGRRAGNTQDIVSSRQHMQRDQLPSPAHCLSFPSGRGQSQHGGRVGINQSVKNHGEKTQNHSSSCSLSNAGEVLQLLRSIQADGEGVQVRGQQAGRGRGRVAVCVPARGSRSQQEGAGRSPAAVPHPRINVAQGRAPLPGTGSPGAARQQEGAVPGERPIPSAAGAISSTTWTGTRRRLS